MGHTCLNSKQIVRDLLGQVGPMRVRTYLLSRSLTVRTSKLLRISISYL
jgi:hypothetical protein